MKLYTYSTARQRLAEVLEEVSREGEVPASGRTRVRRDARVEPQVTGPGPVAE